MVILPGNVKTGAVVSGATTVIFTVSVSVAAGSPLSVTVNVTEYNPAWVKPGVQLNDAFPLPLSMRLGPVGFPLMEKLRT